MTTTLPGSYELREFQASDLPDIQQIRKRAFAPIFDGFRAAAGNSLAARAFADADQEQADYLASICKPDPSVEMRVLTCDKKVIGFCGYRVNEKNLSGVIDLNAVDPNHQGNGAGRYMYEQVCAEMRSRGVTFVEVSTGGDAGHAPARRAYEAAGFAHPIPSVTMYRLL